MTPAVLTAFSNELEKIAAGPHILKGEKHFTRDRGALGMFVPFEGEMSLNESERASFKRHGKADNGAIILANKKDVARTLRGENSKRQWRAFKKQHPDAMGEVLSSTRRHELTHWLRHKQGKTGSMGKPGLRGVLATLREELIANRVGAKRVKTPIIRKAAKGGALASTRGAYPEFGKSLLRAAFKLSPK